jgi:hypothetical protein
MNRVDVVRLVAYVSQLNPAQAIDEFTADAWWDVLGDLPVTFDQARAAAAKVAKRERWIAVSAIHGELLGTIRPHELSAPALAIQAPSKFQENPERAARIARNKEKFAEVRQRIAENRIANDPHEADIPEALRRAREVGREYRREREVARGADPRPPRRRNDPDRLGIHLLNEFPRRATT